MINSKNISKKKLRNFIKKGTKSKRSLETGDIVKLSYVNKKGNVHDEKPTVLILNPKWKRQIHALALRKFSVLELKKLIAVVKADISVIDDVKKIKTYKQVFNVIKNSKRNKKDMLFKPKKFYERTLKRLLQRNTENSYRTFNLKNVRSILTVYDYRFTSKKYEKPIIIGKKNEDTNG